MKHEVTTDISYALTPKDVTALARAIINHADASSAGRMTYLKSLLAGVQVELIGKPVLRALRGNHKAPTVEIALAAFEKVNTIYYDAVLAAVPEGLMPLEKQSKTSFARSSASTLRRAIKLGWNPLVPLSEASKVTLSRWVKEHAPPRQLTVANAQRRAATLIERLTLLLKALPREDSAALRQVVLEDLGEQPVQRLRSVSLRRGPPERIAPH